MEELSTCNKKRVRDDDAAEPVLELPEAKRLKDDFLSGFLDDSDPDAAVLDLDSVIKSFEVEITPGSSPPVDVVDLTSSECGGSQPDLDYLLEASDDELGLPPSSRTVSSEEEAVEVKNDEVTELVRVSSGSPGISSEFWGFEDNVVIPSYDDSFEMGVVGGGSSIVGDYVAFDEGLFEYSNVYFDSAEISDFSWRFNDVLPAE